MKEEMGKKSSHSKQVCCVCVCLRACMHAEVAVSGAREAAALFELQTSEGPREWAFVSRRYCASKYFGSGHAAPRDCSLRQRGMRGDVEEGLCECRLREELRQGGRLKRI